MTWIVSEPITTLSIESWLNTNANVVGTEFVLSILPVNGGLVIITVGYLAP